MKVETWQRERLAYLILAPIRAAEQVIENQRVRPARTHLQQALLLPVYLALQVRVCALAEQEAHHLEVAMLARNVERRLPVAAALVDHVLRIISVAHVSLWVDLELSL